MIVQLRLARDGESEVSLVLAMDRLCEVSVRGFGQPALLVQEVYDTTGTQFHEI